MISIVLVEDHLLFRKGLASILEQDPEVRVTAEFADGNAFITAIKEGQLDHCDLVFLDIALPWKTGLEVLSELSEEHVALPPICILSMYPDLFYLEDAKSLGARGYLNKNVDPETLSLAVKELVSGRTFFLSKEQDTGQDSGMLDSLSSRELEVFKLLARGMTIKEIGYELHISIKSVSTYKTRLMQKLGVDSLSDLYTMTVMYKEPGL